MNSLRKIICIILVSAISLFPAIAAPTDLASGIDIDLGATVSLVATYIANIPVTANVPDGYMANLEFNGEVIASASFKNGFAPIKCNDIAVAGTDEVVVYDGAKALGSKEITVVNPNVWDVTIAQTGSGRVIYDIQFNARISPSTKGYSVQAPVKVQSIDQRYSNVLRIDTTNSGINNSFLYENDVIVVSGVKFPDLFPRYAFTFMIPCKGQAVYPGDRPTAS